MKGYIKIAPISAYANLQKVISIMFCVFMPEKNIIYVSLCITTRTGLAVFKILLKNTVQIYDEWKSYFCCKHAK